MSAGVCGERSEATLEYQLPHWRSCSSVTMPATSAAAAASRRGAVDRGRCPAMPPWKNTRRRQEEVGSESVACSGAHTPPPTAHRVEATNALIYFRKKLVQVFDTVRLRCCKALVYVSFDMSFHSLIIY